MRHCFLILTVCALLQAGQARADDVMLGRVVTVDRDRGALTVEPFDRHGKTETGEAVRAIAVTADKAVLADDIVPGRIVRIWGSFAAGGGGSCRATRISPASSQDGASADATGVRRRLGSGCNMGAGSAGPAMSPMMQGGAGRGRH